MMQPSTNRDMKCWVLKIMLDTRSAGQFLSHHARWCCPQQGGVCGEDMYAAQVSTPKQIIRPNQQCICHK